MNGVIFLGGPPGAGKSCALEEVVVLRPGTIVANAGALIREGRGIGTPGARPLVASVDAAAAFQEILTEQVCALRNRATGPVVLDGHFAVPTPQGPAVIEPEVFRRLGCIALIRLWAPVAELATRLRARSGAAWWDGSEAEIASLTAADERQARTVSSVTAIPLHHRDTPSGAAALVSELLDAPV